MRVSAVNLLLTVVFSDESIGELDVILLSRGELIGIHKNGRVKECKILECRSKGKILRYFLRVVFIIYD